MPLSLAEFVERWKALTERAAADQTGETWEM